MKISNHKSLKKIAVFLLWAGFALLIIFIVILLLNCFTLFAPIDMAATGQIGDFIGGVIGSVWSLSGILFIYATFEQQGVIIQKDHDKFFYGLLLKKTSDEILALKDGSLETHLNLIRGEIWNYLEFDKETEHSTNLIFLSEYSSFAAKLNNILNSYFENVKKFNDKFFEELLSVEIIRIVNCDGELININKFQPYLEEINEAFQNEPKSSEYEIAFVFRGKQLLNFSSDSYSNKIQRLEELKKNILKLKNNSNT